MEQLQAQFTDSVAASTATPCDRSSCRVIIQPGENQYYVANAIQGAPGRHLCESCYLYYRRNPNTVTKRLSVGNQPPIPNVEAIRRDVNESQRQGGHTPQGWVTPLPSYSHLQSGSGPQVIIPQLGPTNGYRQQIAAPLAVHGRLFSGHALGYSAAHLHHSAQTQEWSQKAYKGVSGLPPGYQVPINVEVYRSALDNKGEAVRIPNGIKEGISVPLNILQHQLCQHVQEAVVIPLKSYLRDIPFNIYMMVVRETTKGHFKQIEPDSDTEEGSLRYFQDRFLVASRKKADHGQLVFQAPNKPLVFGVFLPEDLWNKLQTLQDTEYEESLNHQSSRSSEESSREATRSISLSRSLKQKENERSTSELGSLKCKDTEIDASHHRYFEHWEFNDSLTAPPISQAKRMKTSDKVAATKSERKISYESLDSKKRILAIPDIITVDDSSDEQSTPQVRGSPTSINSLASIANKKSAHLIKRNAKTSSIASINARKQSYKPLDFAAIRRGFQKGGVNPKTAVSHCLSENIIFFPLPEASFASLIKDPQSIMGINIQLDGMHFRGYLVYDPEKRLGTGTFKTAIPASLEFEGSRIPENGLGSLKVNGNKLIPVALKRPFILEPASKSSRRGRKPVGNTNEDKASAREVRLAVVDEQHVITGEANLLIWGNALLKFAYDSIHDQIEKRHELDEEIPAFIDGLPHFRFVQAGVAVAIKSVETGKSGKPSSHRAVYLLEELLPGEPSDFVKYINNASALPSLDPSDPDYYLAEFLTFIQHVQYSVTGKAAYISDFQGVGETLTDPQILTNPDMGQDLFGDGNLGQAFNMFPSEHQCTKYCEWFKLVHPSEMD